MARNRVIYQSEGLFVSQDNYTTGIEGHEQLRRVQSANYSFSAPREDVFQYGELGRIGTLNIETATVSLDFSYFATDGFNERALGFSVQTGDGDAARGFASGHMIASSGVNMYILTTTEGRDLNGDAISTNDVVIGVGNATVTDYTVDASVGSIPTVSVSMEGENIRSDNAVGPTAIIDSPAVDAAGVSLTDPVILPQPKSMTTVVGEEDIIALRPGDITLNFGNWQTTTGSAPISVLGGSTGSYIQSASISIPLSRSPLEKLGSQTPYARVVDFPVVATLTVNAIVNEVGSQNLVDILSVGTTEDITLALKTSTGATGLFYDFKQAVLTDESFSSSIGSNKSVDLTFTTTIGGPSDVTTNILVSGQSTGELWT